MFAKELKYKIRDQYFENAAIAGSSRPDKNAVDMLAVCDKLTKLKS